VTTGCRRQRDKEVTEVASLASRSLEGNLGAARPECAPKGVLSRRPSRYDQETVEESEKER
jgi:hypothetical protein